MKIILLCVGVLLFLFSFCDGRRGGGGRSGGFGRSSSGRSGGFFSRSRSSSSRSSSSGKVTIFTLSVCLIWNPDFQTGR